MTADALASEQAPTGVFHSRVKLDCPFPIDIELPEVTW
jgi:hypothetical protein